MKVNRHLLAIISLFIISLAFRFIPLMFSNLPFNIDGFPLVRISEDIIESGHWSLSYPEGTSELAIYNAKMPIFSILISIFSIVFGKSPLEIVQVLMPFMSSTAVILIYFIAFKITKNQLVSFFAGLALALNGLYVYFGAAVMKETLGLVLLILAVYLYYTREDLRKRIMASVLILILPLTHHLTAWICFIMVSLLMLSSNALHWNRGTFKRNRFAIDFFSGPFLFIFTVLYYEAVDLAFFNRISGINDIALFSSVFILGAIFSIMFSLPKKKIKPVKVIINKTAIVPIIGFGLLVLNHYKRIFPGTIHTTTPFLIYFLPYLLLISIAVIGLNVVAKRKTEHRPLVAALILAPFIVIIYALVKSLDAFTFMLIYRSYDYIDFGLAICTGIGAGYIINRIVKILFKKKEPSKTTFGLKAVLSIIFILICLSTVPLAYNGQEFFGVQDATYDHEFEAMNWLDENIPKQEIESDERLCDIIDPYFDLKCDKTLPLKLKWGKSLDRESVLLMEDKWKDYGAQMSPMEPKVISQKTFDNTIGENNLIYNTGGYGSQIFIVKVR